MHRRHYSDRKSTRLNSSHLVISYAVFCLKKKKNNNIPSWSRACDQTAHSAVLRLRYTSCHQCGPTHIHVSHMAYICLFFFFFFFNDTATTEIYTLSLHDALPICLVCLARKVDRHLDAARRKTGREGIGRDGDHHGSTRNADGLCGNLHGFRGKDKVQRIAEALIAGFDVDLRPVAGQGLAMLGLRQDDGEL